MPVAVLASATDEAHFVAVPPPVPEEPPVDEPPVDEPPVDEPPFAPPVPDVLPPVPVPLLPPLSSPGSESSVVQAVVRLSKKSVDAPIENLSMRVVLAMFVSVPESGGLHFRR
jgi:hypothetical protein